MFRICISSYSSQPSHHLCITVSQSSSDLLTTTTMACRQQHGSAIKRKLKKLYFATSGAKDEGAEGQPSWVLKEITIDLMRTFRECVLAKNKDIIQDFINALINDENNNVSSFRKILQETQNFGLK